MKKYIIILLLSIFVFQNTAHAILRIEPSRLNIIMERDAVFKSSYSLTNEYDDDMEVSITVNDWHSYKGNGDLDINNWLNITPTKIKIKKGEKRMVLFSVHTDKTMSGSISGQITFSYNPPGNQGLNFQMSIPLYVVIKGTEKLEYNIEDIKFSAYSGLYKAVFTIKNTGNIHIRPLGKMNIYDEQKTIVQSYDVPESYPVYAETTRSDFSAIFPQSALKPGNIYTAEVIMHTVDNPDINKTKIVNFRVNKDGSLTLK